MILALDVHYRDDVAKAVGVVFDTWTDEDATEVFTTLITEVEDYIPGEFYKRELPCLLAVIDQVTVPIKCIVIDGYVTLGAVGKPGLGQHLYNALEQKVPVIGVAKSSYAGNNPDVRAILRGNSVNPLFITSAGIDVETAARQIVSMAGEYRFPALLSLLDQETKRD